MMNETEMEMFVMSYLISLIFSLGISLIRYVFTSLGYYTLAKRRGINHPWLAWVPLGNMWILGSLSDQYRYVTRGQETNKRKVLLGMDIAALVMAVLLMVLTVNIVIEAIPMMDQFNVSEAQIASVGVKALGMLAICFVVLVLSIIAMVFMYIAIFDVFRSCDPNSSVLFLVLTILLSIVYPFLVFACRNKDLGMPPRTVTPPVQQPVYNPQPPVEPWDNVPQE